MGEQRIEAALQEATDTQNVNIVAGAIDAVPEIFGRDFGNRPAVVVADENTFEAAGKEVQRRLEGAGHTMREPYVFPAEPPLYAEYANIEKLRDSLREHDAIPVAVGSGTLNDIVKRSAHECERPYMCVATAASMDGYTAFGRKRSASATPSSTWPWRPASSRNAWTSCSRRRASGAVCTRGREKNDDG